MADNESRLPPACATDGFPDDPQLDFEFPNAGSGSATPRRIPDRSCRNQPARRPGHSLGVPTAERSLEELDLAHGVSAYLPPGKVLCLRLTENRYTIISVQRRRECYRVRVHRMFAGSGPRIVRALARYIVHNDQRASALLSQFIEANQDQIRRQPKRVRPVVLRTQGHVHDLRAVYDRLNRAFFDGRLDMRITWGSARRCPAQRSIKIGTYQVEDRLIRVHPVLDQEMVPRYFLDWIVFHEMLHGKHTIRRIGGRRCFHPPEFAREEKHFPDYWRARAWEKANLDRLLE